MLSFENVWMFKLECASQHLMYYSCILPAVSDGTGYFTLCWACFVLGFVGLWTLNVFDLFSLFPLFDPNLWFFFSVFCLFCWKHQPAEELEMQTSLAKARLAIILYYSLIFAVPFNQIKYILKFSYCVSLTRNNMIISTCLFSSDAAKHFKTHTERFLAKVER